MDCEEAWLATQQAYDARIKDYHTKVKWLVVAGATTALVSIAVGLALNYRNRRPMGPRSFVGSP